MFVWIMSGTTPSKSELLQQARGLRCIRNIEITSCDIQVLIDGSRKLGGLLIDAVGAKLQEWAEDNGCSHWVVLSAWLGPLAEGEIPEGTYAAMILDHVEQAVHGRKGCYNLLSDPFSF